MQTTKSRPGSLNVPRKTSPGTPRTGSKLKTPGPDSDSLSSPSHNVRKTPKDTSPNVVNRQSPRSPAAEKKKTSKVSELESQVAHLQDELKHAKDQLTSSESCKKKAQQEADDAKIQFAAILSQLEKTQNQLNEISDSEDSRIRELREISQDRDKAWQSELEAVQKQQSMDLSALASALNEIQRLKTQLNKISESEASQARHAESAHAEIHGLRVELTQTLELVEKLKSQLSNSRESEARALEEVGKAQVLLEVVKSNEVTLKSENGNVIESLVAELEESKNKVNYLEGLVSKFQADFAKAENGVSDHSEILKTEINNLKNELESAEKRYQDQYREMTMHIKDVNEFVKRAKMESREREGELEAKLKKSSVELEEVKTKLMEKQTELQNKLNKSDSALEGLKACLVEKEMHLQSLKEDNETLKSEILKRETGKSRENHEILALAEAARASEQEALMKLRNLSEEADKNSRKVERLTKELNAAQAASSEMEVELRRLKVQSDQWRKAAEAAAAMVTSGNNGKYGDTMGNLDFQTMGSPFSEDEMAVKKNGNVLKKLGVLLKKGQK